MTFTAPGPVVFGPFLPLSVVLLLLLLLLVEGVVVWMVTGRAGWQVACFLSRAAMVPSKPTSFIITVALAVATVAAFGDLSRSLAFSLFLSPSILRFRVASSLGQNLPKTLRALHLVSSGCSLTCSLDGRQSFASSGRPTCVA